jgi:hypothetical protein
MIGKMFCVSCQCFRDKEEMKLIDCGKRKGWRCPVCIQKRAVAKYKGKENAITDRN